VRRKVEVVLGHASLAGSPGTALDPEPGGYFSGEVPEAAAGALYRFRLDGQGPFPDPASRFQPEGPHGPSEVVDPTAFRWTDSAWKGRPIEGQVIYEMHIGAFTPEGTWDAAGRQLRELAAIGITVLEVMPVADFPGRFGWGYDGVGLFSPTWLYGRPDDFRRFVNNAHEAGLSVILDVVYNHVGPDGNYLPEFSPGYFTSRYANDWGAALNFDGHNAAPVREFFLSNAAYWIDEFHLDGLRLDATQQIFDASPDHIVKLIGERVRETAGGRETIVVAENEPQDNRMIRPAERGGYGLDGLWNDDYHHSAMVAITGRNEAYYTDYHGKPQEFISAVKYGFLFQGQRYKWQRHRRGTPAWGLRPAQFVTFIQNHDQIANSARGERVHKLASPGNLRAMTALLLLGPNTPMLFQGQEFAASSPFFYFVNHKTELNELVRRGRIDFMTQFRSLSKPAMRACQPDAASPATFARCKLDFAERRSHAEIYQLHQDLLRLRRDDAVFCRQQAGGLDGAVLGEQAFVLRFFGSDGQDRLLLVNFGVDLHLDPAPEPLLAPPDGLRWKVLWSSEDPCYGGCGTFPPDTEDNWRIPGNAALALSPAQPEEVDEAGEVRP
jgi:maltooligosyltrehalose trehalohydrolase